MPLKWPYLGKQKGSSRVRHVRRLSMEYGRVYLLASFTKLYFYYFVAENVFIKLRTLTPSYLMYVLILCYGLDEVH